jgi:glycosyltransferase involved in cell wall biosynthesis
LTLVGEGCHRPSYEAFATKLGIAKAVTFTGVVPFGDGIQRVLAEADLFVLPSLTEGLPRALLEAMARALPCIASDVGGIPELLPPECLVPPRDSRALADSIASLLSDPVRMTAASACNLALARRYQWNKVVALNVDFYTHLRTRTERWLTRQSIPIAHEGFASY